MREPRDPKPLTLLAQTEDLSKVLNMPLIVTAKTLVDSAIAVSSTDVVVEEMEVKVMENTMETRKR